jgi:DNA-binding NarL/FixJ family response regulator
MTTLTGTLLETPWTFSAAQSSIRVLTVDPDPLVREGLATVINKETGMEVVAEAATGSRAIEYFRENRPDVVTLSLLLPDLSGHEVARLILGEFPGARIVVITSVRGDVQLLRILESGVRGLVLKGVPHRELIETIRQVHAGKRMIPRNVASMLAEHLGEETLTPREVQVLSLVAKGNRNKQVAAHLSIADETVRMHMKNILSKLSANDRTHAVTIALSRGMFEL